MVLLIWRWQGCRHWADVALGSVFRAAAPAARMNEVIARAPHGWDTHLGGGYSCPAASVSAYVGNRLNRGAGR